MILDILWTASKITIAISVVGMIGFLFAEIKGNVRFSINSIRIIIFGLILTSIIWIICAIIYIILNWN